MPKPTYDQRAQKVDGDQYNAGRDINFDIPPSQEPGLFPLPDPAMWHYAGGLAKTLMIVGGLLFVGGFFIFALYSGSGGYGSAPIGWVIGAIGLIFAIIGNVIGRNDAYKKRLENQRRSPRERDD